MNKIISKELLSALLDMPIEYFCCDGSWVEYNNPMLSINIYELAHKCKEWAIKQKINGVEIIFATTFFPYSENIRVTFSYRDTFHPVKFHEENANTEPEAIFKACQWILDNKDETK